MLIGLFSFLIIEKTNRFHVAVDLFSNRSQRTSKCGKNISDTLDCGSCTTSLFLPHFDVICYLLMSLAVYCFHPGNLYDYVILCAYCGVANKYFQNFQS